MFRLHRFLGPYSIESGHADPHVLGEAVSDKNGAFNFGEVPSGKFVIFVGAPSEMSIEVELVKPKTAESDTLAVNNFAEAALAAVFPANGRKLDQ